MLALGVAVVGIGQAWLQRQAANLPPVEERTH